MQYFRESYADFPKGMLKSSESPDFVLEFKNYQQIGIELTRLNPGNAAPPEYEEIKNNEWRENLIIRSREVFEQSSSLKLFS